MKRALVVDDSQYFRNTIKDILEEYNFEVIEAVNGLDAYEKYISYTPNIVTMDINMPILDGFKSIAKILNFDSNAKIIICSSMMFLDVYIAEGLESGAKACLCKPFTKSELLNAIDEVLMEE